jgi:hypothetical protein
MLAPPGVVQVLLAAGSIDTGRLEMAKRIGTDPHLLPRRRYRHLGDALDRGLILQSLAVLIQVREPASASDPPQTDAGTIRAPQPLAAG